MVDNMCVFLSLNLSICFNVCVYVSGVVVVVELVYGIQVGGGGGSQRNSRVYSPCINICKFSEFR